VLVEHDAYATTAFIARIDTNNAFAIAFIMLLLSKWWGTKQLIK
jgi:hypothetical protein